MASSQQLQTTQKVGKSAADGVGAAYKTTADSLVTFSDDLLNARSFSNSLQVQVNVTLSYVNDKDYYIHEIDSMPTRLNENIWEYGVVPRAGDTCE